MNARTIGRKVQKHARSAATTIQLGANRRNALKTEITGPPIPLVREDAALYEQHVQSFFEELKPVDGRETELVQSIADSKWRLARIPGMEFGIYALGRVQFAEEFKYAPKAEAAVLTDAKTFMTFQRQLNDLSIQEARLRGQCEKDTAGLNGLQRLRAAVEPAQAFGGPKPQAEIGFEFSTSELEALEDHLGLNHDFPPLP